jgi:hypothetical protein
MPSFTAVHKERNKKKEKKRKKERKKKRKKERKKNNLVKKCCNPNYSSK